MNPGNYNIVLEQGCDFDMSISWQSGGTTVDITGYNADFQIKTDNGDIVWSTTGTEPKITIDTVNNKFVIHIPASETQEYNFNLGSYEFEVISPSNNKYRLLVGTVALRKELI